MALVNVSSDPQPGDAGYYDWHDNVAAANNKLKAALDAAANGDLIGADANSEPKAVASTTFLKRHVEDVTIHGAVGDGGTDDLQAFKDADAALGADPGIIYVPPTANSYLLSAAFVPSSNREIIGGGRHIAQLRASSTANNIIELAGVSNVGIRHLGFTHGATAEAGGKAIATTANCFDIAIVDNEFLDIPRQCIEGFSGFQGLLVAYNRFENIFRAPVVVVNSRRCLVVGNEMYGFGDDGIAFNGNSEWCEASHNIIHTPKLDDTLVRGDDTSGASILFQHKHGIATGNICIKPVKGMIRVAQDNTSATTPGELVFSGNVLSGMSDAANVSSQDGIQLLNVDTYQGKLLFESNILDTQSATTYYTGFAIRTGAAGPATIEIARNTFRTGTALPVNMLVGPLDFVEVADNEVDTSTRFMRIETATAGGRIRLKGNYGDVRNSDAIALAGTSAKLDYLEIGEHNFTSSDSTLATLVQLSQTALTRLRYKPNEMPAGVAPIAGFNGVDTFVGSYERTVTHDFGSVADGATATTSKQVIGAQPGMHASAAIDTDLPAGVFLVAEAEDALVSVTLVNMSGAAYDAPSATLRLTAWRDE